MRTNKIFQTLLSMGPVALLIVAACSGSNAQVINGNFGTGDLTGWTVFTTPNGTANAGGSPDVQSFDTTGTGASNSAHFNVGQLVFSSGDYEGGGIYQDITLGAGPASFSAAIAAISDLSNAEFGLFDMLLDGNVIASDDFGPELAGTYRGNLSATETVTAGVHQLEFEITRPFESGVGDTPNQYITNIVANSSSLPTGTPEPGIVAFLAAFGASGLAAIRLKRARGAAV